MSDKLTWNQAVAHMGDEPRLQQYLKGDDAGDHPVFDLHLSIADGMMKSAIVARYTSDSYDAWTADTIPLYVRQYLFWMLLGSATSSDDARPDQINNYAGVAAGWLDDVKKGDKKIPELVEIASTVAGSTGGSNVRVSAPSTTRNAANASGNIFDPDNPDYRWRDRPL